MFSVILFVLLLMQVYSMELEVSGDGRVEITPDTSMLSVTIQTEARYASEAVDSNAENSSMITSSLRAFADQDIIRERDIATVGFSINPVYVEVVNTSSSGVEERTRRLDGYRVLNQLSVKIRDPEATGEVLDAISTVSESSTAIINVEGIRFFKDDIHEDENEAIARAIGNARETAQTIATEIGATLGFVKEFSMDVIGMPLGRELQFPAMSMMRSTPTTISVGTYQIQRSVQLKYNALHAQTE